MKIKITERTGKNQYFSGQQSSHSAFDESWIIVNNKYKVSVWFFESVESAFKKLQPFLIEDGWYDWRDLIGEDFVFHWNLPTQVVVACLQHIAEQPDSPLIVHSGPDMVATSFQLRTTCGSV